MIKRIFVSYSYTNREKYRQFHEDLVKYFSANSVEVYAFVFDFREKVDDRTLMDSALKEIEKSDLLLAEVTDKSVGVGIEVGYAKAKGIKTGYLFKKDSEYQKTIGGTADFVVDYLTSADVVCWFENNSW
jgi:nucleoside 2-deoxyribosyltransferase